MARLLIAVETYATHRRGRSEFITAGEVAELGSWVVENNPRAFRPLEIRWPAPPAPKVDKSTAAAPVEPTDVEKALLASPSVSPASMQRKRGGRPTSQPT